MGFSACDEYLAESVATVAATGFSRNARVNLLAPRRFCMLHGRQFLAAVPSLDDTLSEYLNRVFEPEELPMLLEHYNAFGHFRVVRQVESNGISRLLMSAVA